MFIGDDMKYDDRIKKLSNISYKVTQEGFTEPPFTNKYCEEFRDGIYVDIISREVLFLSTDKYDSGCGWPAFAKPVSDEVLVEADDYSYNMKRKEVKAKKTSSHLGHVFQDGPERLGGLRYCINSAAIEFIAKEDLEKEGYGDYLHMFEVEDEDK